jgi:hypothetical protein
MQDLNQQLTIRRLEQVLIAFRCRSKMHSDLWMVLGTSSLPTL